MSYSFANGFLSKSVTEIAKEAVEANDKMVDPFKAGYLRALEDLVRELKDADGFTIRGMTVPISNLRAKVRKL